MYFGVLAVEVVERRRRALSAEGMARTLLAMALAQALVAPAVALVAGKTQGRMGCRLRDRRARRTLRRASSWLRPRSSSTLRVSDPFQIRSRGRCRWRTSRSFDAATSTSLASGGEVRGHPDLVWDVYRLGWPDQQIYSEIEGAMQFNAEWADAWDGWEVGVEVTWTPASASSSSSTSGGARRPRKSRRHALRPSVDAPGGTGDQDADVRERGRSPRSRRAVGRKTLAPTPDCRIYGAEMESNHPGVGCHPLHCVP